MFTKPDPVQLQKLARLARNPDAEALLQVLDAELKRVLDVLMDCALDNTLRLQGQARLLTDLTGLVRVAPELAERNARARSLSGM